MDLQPGVRERGGKGGGGEGVNKKRVRGQHNCCILRSESLFNTRTYIHVVKRDRRNIIRIAEFH